MGSPEIAPKCRGAADRCAPPPVVWRLAAYLGAFVLFGLWLTYAARSGLLAPWVNGTDVSLLHAVYALAWGCLGACVNAALAAAKHCAERDFDPSWNW
jgi:hypothetical protein